MNRLRKRVSIWPGAIAATFLALTGIDAAGQTQLLHPTNTVWRYQTDLAVQQAAGTDWITPGFDDSAWPQGVGLFGNEANYPYPMNTTGAGLANGLPVANYFRAHFTWSGSTAGVMLTGTNYIDDGSIIYLNGVEIARFNMGPEANAGTPEVSAPVANPGGYPNVNGGEPVLVRLAIPLGSLTNGNPNPLVVGDNIIAVQAHQQGTGSSDRVFGLSLYGGGIPDCFPDYSQFTNRVILEGRSTTFTIVANCLPLPTIQWYRDVGAGEEVIPGATGTSYTLTNPLPFDSGVYYAKITTLSGTVTSRQAVLIVMEESLPPRLLSGRLGANNLEIIVTADEALCSDDSCAGDATLTFNWEIYVEGNQSEQLGIARITVNGNVLTFTLASETPWTTDTRYVVGLLPFGGGSIGDLYGNLLNGGDPFSSVVAPAAASAISLKGFMGISDLYTFDEPPSSREFSTFNWAGGASDVSSAATLNTFVQTLNVTEIGTTLPEATGNPPSGFGTARYASETKNLITRPAGVIGNVILAHLRNDSGSPAGMVTLNYTLTNREPNVTEGIPGLRVYYSLSGASNTWNPVYVSPNEDATGPKTGFVELRFSPWLAGADMYILFVDDNAPGFEVDGIYELDNFKVQAHRVVCSCSEPPTLVRASAPNPTMIVLTFSERMAPSAGTTAPYAVSGATVQSATLSTDGIEVTLTTTTRPVGTSTVTITGLRDASTEGNLTAPNPISFRLTTVQKVTGWADAWSYNTNNLDAAPTWTTTGGTGWLTGNALFGTETSGGVVAIMPTLIATVIPPPNTNNEFMVSYFRKTVTLPALAAGQSYAIGYMVDDGAVFYLDGAEIGRVNMPAGPVGYTTNALAGIEGSPQALPFTATAGDHVLAVEVHQNANTSSDTLFGASVLVVPTASPALSIAPVGTNVTVSWNADSSWALVGSTNVAGPYTAVPGAAPPSYSRPRHVPATLFYKLNYVPQP